MKPNNTNPNKHNNKRKRKLFVSIYDIIE